MLDEWLKGLGLGKNEIKVYLTLYDVGGKGKAANLIKSTKLHPNLVYRALEELVDKKLVSKIEKNNIFYFEITAPDAIKELADEKIRLAQLAITALKNKQNETTRDIRIFEGIDGLKNIHEKTLELSKGETVFVLGGSKLTQTAELEKYWDAYHDRRIARGINFKILYDRTVLDMRVHKRARQALSEARFLPFNFDLPTWFEFFGDLVVIGVPGVDPLIFTFHSVEVVQSLKKFFDYLWEQDKQ